MKTLNGILKGFNKTLARLDRLVEKNGFAISTNLQEIVRLEDENHQLHAEADKAKKVADNLRALLEG